MFVKRRPNLKTEFIPSDLDNRIKDLQDKAGLDNDINSPSISEKKKEGNTTTSKVWGPELLELFVSKNGLMRNGYGKSCMEVHALI